MEAWATCRTSLLKSVHLLLSIEAAVGYSMGPAKMTQICSLGSFFKASPQAGETYVSFTIRCFFQMKHDVQRFPTWDCVRSMSFYPKAPHPAAHHVPLRPWHLAAPHLTRCCRVAFSRDAATWGMGNRGGDHRNSRDVHVASPDSFLVWMPGETKVLTLIFSSIRIIS